MLLKVRREVREQLQEILDNKQPNRSGDAVSSTQQSGGFNSDDSDGKIKLSISAAASP